MRQARLQKDFCLTFQPLDTQDAGVRTITDAARGNVAEDGSVSETAAERVGSQSAYWVVPVDKALLSGKRGRFCIIDSRSYGLPKIARSSYAVESYSLVEGIDAANVVRGQFAELLGHRGWSSKDWHAVIDEVPLVGVVDACDTHDRVRSDVWATTGAQKSLAFCVAALRQVFRAAAVLLRWTHPENTVVDGMTQEMDVLHLCRIVLGGVWSIECEPSMMKASREALKHAEKAQAASALCAE